MLPFPLPGLLHVICDLARRSHERTAELTPAQYRAARGLLGWTREQLAEASGVPARTIADFELANTKPRASTINGVAAALMQAGVALEAEGVRMQAKRADPGKAAIFAIAGKHASAMARELSERFGGEQGNAAFELAIGEFVAITLTKPGNDAAKNINEVLALFDLAWRLQPTLP